MRAAPTAIALSLAISLAGAGAFLLATLLGDYDWVARIGGSVWVFVLSMIIALPTVMPWVGRRRDAP